MDIIPQIMNIYKPKPIDTSSITLTPELLALRERLAENAHDVWAVGRIRAGWIYGKTRNDELKTHPDLLPYDQLSESEKEFDRQTAMETIKAIIALGYKITPFQE